jgi:hypothetical protein
MLADDPRARIDEAMRRLTRSSVGGLRALRIG